MQKTIFHRLSSVLWALIVSLVVVLAIYVSVGRLLVSSLESYQSAILNELNYRVPFTIEAAQVSGEWQSFTPVIVLGGLRLSAPGSDLPPLTLSEGRVAVDVFNSLRTRSLQMTRLALDGLELRGELTEEGRLRIRGFEGGGEIGEWLKEFLLNIELIGLRNNKLKLELPGGEERTLDVYLRMQREGSYRRLEIELLSSRGARIDILGEGVGNPFVAEEFTGDIYTSISTGDLGAIRQVLANRLPGVWADGALNLELWLSLVRGKSELQGRLSAANLLISDDSESWQLPLDQVNLEAQLVQGGDRWTLYASDLAVRQGEQLFQVPRLQLDAWGEALRIRASEVPLAPLNAIATGEIGVSAALVDVFRQLEPAGTISSLQLSAGDIGHPASDWEVEARFSDVRVNSWRGRPGVTSASGYLQMIPGSGEVLLDSRDLTLDFPSVFQQPLVYSDMHGALRLAWDQEVLRVTSDLITVTGEEGTAKLLFGLDVPLQKNDVGSEMNLLVGLQDSHPVHRVKYVPNVLNPGLRRWLSGSIGDGVVREGAFLWRGALKAPLRDRRTIQLAFNVSDTAVDYHPRWPAVNVRDGIILVDGARVSVWANHAELHQSEVRRLSVETWLDKDRQLMLEVDGQMRGPAADGLVVLNSSPIDDLVKSAFRKWTLEGALETDLKLKLNLNDRKTPAEVEVATRWQRVDVDILPGSLPLRDVSGSLNYGSDSGFSSEGLVGSLWGKPLTARVEQTGEVYDPASSVTRIRVDTRADMADIVRWLDFRPLAFASGESAVDVQVQVAPGKAPLLRVHSELEGVSLDLPTPWEKRAADARTLRLSMALGQRGRPLELALGEDLSLHLDLRQGALYAGALGIGEQPAQIEQGVLRVTGRTSLLDGDELSQFLATYFFPGWLEEEEAGAPSAPPRGLEGLTDLAIDLDAVGADTLSIWGQTVPDVVVSLRIDGGQSHLAVETDWLDAEYLQLPREPVAVLVVKRLDLEGLQHLSLDTTGEALEPLEFADMGVSIARLHRGDFEFGKLSFDLRGEGPNLQASNITGDIAGLRLGEPEAGSLLWERGSPGRTALNLGVAFDDFGTILGRFGYEKILETEDGRFDLDLDWPGAPQEFSLRQGQGAVKVAIGPGRFLEAPSGASGALKVVNILNLADLVQRLSMSHMFESGIPFDRVEGEVFLHSGAIEVAGMDVKGPSSFHFSGIADVGARSLDGELVATLPVADNLPWVAALTAGLPVAAGVFVVSKLLEKQVDRLSSAVYSIRGSWDDPQVKFKQIFDSSNGRGEEAIARAAAAREAAPDPDAPPASPPDSQEPVQSPP